MKNIKILKTGIDVSKIKKQLEKYPEDWGSQQKLKNVKLKDPHEYITSVDVLQLVMGGITNQMKMLVILRYARKLLHIKNTLR